jgi:hypothetical protein
MNPFPTFTAAIRRSITAPTVLALAGIVIASGCSSIGRVLRESGPASGRPDASNLPRTRAERTSYRETSSHADVLAFIDSLQKLGAPIAVGEVATTTQGRSVPYVIASRPLVTTPAQAHRLGRPIVYVQGNIHSGEVEGKEALQMLLRDLLFSRRANALDSVVLIAVPNYNADGNENLAPQARARGSQNGPEMVGTRANAQNLNLNRDYMKADAPETRGSLDMFNAWDPDIFLDLHTSNGSYHGYALTYSPSLNPAAFFGGVYARDTILPVLRERMRTRHRFETFDYGNFRGPDSTGTITWYTYEHVPRFGSNYYGLRGRIGLLSEAYSHDPFERRVASTYAFVQEVLSFAAERSGSILALSRRADERTTAWGLRPDTAPAIPIRSGFTTSPFTAAVLVEDVPRTPGDTVRHEPGLRPGERRSGVIKPVSMRVIDRFEPTLSRRLPTGYVLDATHADAVRLLRQHGLVVQRLDAEWRAPVEVFTADSVVALNQFEGHRPVRLAGRWRTETRSLSAGSYLISTAQPLGVLAAYLLEPESDDGLVTWNVFDRVLTPGSDAPIVKVTAPLAVPATIVR